MPVAAPAVPDVVRATAVAAGAAWWLADLPGLVARDITVGGLETGLVATQVGLQPAAGQMLEVADRVAL
jgi:hypothetical protein